MPARTYTHTFLTGSECLVDGLGHDSFTPVYTLIPLHGASLTRVTSPGASCPHIRISLACFPGGAGGERE